MTATTATRVCCTRCETTLPTDERLLVGEVLHCPKCNVQLEVFGLDPIEIGPRIRIEAEEEDFEGWPKAG